MDKIRRRPVRDQRAKGSSLAQITSAMTALTAACALLISGLSLKVTRDGQLTSRFASAIEQLGNGSPDTKVGAIYALSRLAIDSKPDRPIVVDLLTDYIQAGAGPTKIEAEKCRSNGPTPRDVVAALRVLFFQITHALRTDEVDLRQVCLNQVRFPRADLTCVVLDNAVIAGSDFEDATVTDASLAYADLQSNRFIGADFTRADLHGALFGNDNTDISSADLTEAVFRDAQLDGATIVDVDLSGADLTNALLDDADLRKSNLDQARLSTYLGGVRNLPPEAHPTRGPVARPSPPQRRCTK